MDFQIANIPYPIGCWVAPRGEEGQTRTIDEPPLEPNGNPVAFAGARFDSLELGLDIEIDEAVAATLGLAVRRAWSLPDGEDLPAFFASFLGGSTVILDAPDRGVSIARFGRTYHPAEGAIRTALGKTIEFYALVTFGVSDDELGDLARGAKRLLVSPIGRVDK
jgi:hypothetical protein